MSFELEPHIAAWYENGKVTNAVAMLFSLLGQKLATRQLTTAVELTQPLLRGKDASGNKLERRQTPQLSMVDMVNLKAVMGELSLIDPFVLRTMFPLTCTRRSFDVAVVLGATMISMRSRINALIDQSIAADRLIALTGLRPINEEEQEEITALGLNPKGKTEADAAGILFANMNVERISKDQRVLVTADPTPGNRPNTDETLLDLKRHVLDPLPDGSTVVIALHVPSGLRQALTVRRVFGRSFARHTFECRFGGFTKPLEQLTGIVLDESCRILYEILQLTKS